MRSWSRIVKNGAPSLMMTCLLLQDKLNLRMPELAPTQQPFPLLHSPGVWLQRPPCQALPGIKGRTSEKAPCSGAAFLPMQSHGRSRSRLRNAMHLASCAAVQAALDQRADTRQASIGLVCAQSPESLDPHPL